MATILFFGRFSDISNRLDVELPDTVTNKASLSHFLSGKIEGFADLAAKPDTRISVNMMVSMNESSISNDDEIAYMSALSGG